MLTTELFENHIVLEWGSNHGFPGFGRGLFRRAAWQQAASWIENIEDPDVKMALGHFFASAFQRDNPSFKSHTFLEWIETGKANHSARFLWQQRHYWYFAQLIKDLPADQAPMKQYLGRWLGDRFHEAREDWEDAAEQKFHDSDRSGWGGYTRSKFTRSLWDSATEQEDADPRVAKYPYSAGRMERKDD